MKKYTVKKLTSEIAAEIQAACMGGELIYPSTNRLSPINDNRIVLEFMNGQRFSVSFKQLKDKPKFARQYRKALLAEKKNK
jgi:hypothetical protein